MADAGDAADAARLPEAHGPHARQLFLRLHAELRHGGEIEMMGNPPRFHRLKPLDLLGLFLDVAGVFCLQGDLLDHVRRVPPRRQR